MNGVRLSRDLHCTGTEEVATTRWRRSLQLSVVLTIAAATSVLAQAPDLRPELTMRADVRGISVSPAGVLWLTTFFSEVYRSDDGGRTWAEVKLPSIKAPDLSWSGDHLDQVTFFDATRGMISGHIGTNPTGILLTAAGGGTWKAVPLPIEGLFWVYDVQATADGHAWLAGSSGDVLASDDYGQTWRVLAKPFSEEQRAMSVWFDSPLLGAAGSMDDGAVAMTRDGGRTWSTFEAAKRSDVLRGCPGHYGDSRVDRVRINAKRLIVAQCGGVFAASIETPRSWTAITAGGQPLVDFAMTAAGNLVGVTNDRHVIEETKDGAVRVLATLDRLPAAMSVSGSRIVLIDETKKVTSFDGTSWHASRLLGQGVGTSWPIQMLDRGAGDLLWGVSRLFLYRSADGGRTWERVTELPANKDGLDVTGVHVQSDGDVLLYDGWGWVRRWDVRAGRMTSVPVLNGMDVVGSFRRADVWLLFGGQQFRIELLPTFVDGQRGGTSDYGFVAASTDGGRTWSMIDRWEDGGPQAAFLSDDNRLTLLAPRGVRHGAVTISPTIAAKMQTLLPATESRGAPYLHEATVLLDLLDAPRGWISATAKGDDRVVYRTVDGGRSWKTAQSTDYPNIALYRLFDGTWIGMTAQRQLQRWTGTKFVPVPTAPAPLTRAWVDSQGSLSLWSEDGSIHVLDVQAGKLRRIAQ
jgi:photosystem II stability/assembly factor-like uncharacterized protein